MSARGAERVLVTRRIPGSTSPTLGEIFDVDVHDSDVALGRDALLERVAGAAGALTMVSDRVDEGFLEAGGDDLRVVANFAVGFDNIDVAAATRHGVLVANTPDVLSQATAELAMSLLLALLRRVAEGDRILRGRAPWAWSPTWMIGRGLPGRTLGIVGLGRIGREFARLALAFGMEVIYTNRSGAAGDVPYRAVDLDELLAEADVVSLHCPLTEDTHHLIGSRELAAMKPDAVLVNTARGPVVDEVALALALRERVIAGAALDVFEFEPGVNEHLVGLENVVLTPHIGSSTAEVREAMGGLCVNALTSVLVENRCPPNALNPEVMQPV